MRKDKIDLIVDDLADEYKEILISAAMQNSKDGELSIKHLLNLDESVKNTLRNNSKNRKYYKFQLLGVIYFLVGLLMAFFALYQRYFMYSSNQTFTLISLTMLLLGMYIVLFSFLMQSVGKNMSTRVKRVREFSLEVRVLDLYSRIERITLNTFDGSEKMTLRESINKLLLEKKISSEESQILKEFMGLRNKIVHYSLEGDLGNSDKNKKLLNDTEYIITKLEIEQKIR
ncbi:TPA: hypothetical protein ACHU58_000445 [Streptococcus suis]